MTEELEPRVAGTVDGPASETAWPISWPELRDLKSVTRAVVCTLVGTMLIGLLLLVGGIVLAIAGIVGGVMLDWS